MRRYAQAKIAKTGDSIKSFAQPKPNANSANFLALWVKRADVLTPSMSTTAE